MKRGHLEPAACTSGSDGRSSHTFRVTDSSRPVGHGPRASSCPDELVTEGLHQALVTCAQTPGAAAPLSCVHPAHCP